MNILIQPLRTALVANTRDKLQVLVRLQAPAENNTPGTTETTRKPLALAIVLDRSGSMAGAKLREARRCTERILQSLADTDMASLTVYDDAVDTLLGAAPLSTLRPVVHGVVNSINEDGSTNLHGGWLQGADTLAALSSSGRICRVMLLSDGQANAGLTEPEAIYEQVAALARAGITTTTVGFGSHFNEALMTGMAQAGMGNAWYGERAEDLEEAFESELSLLQATAYTDVSLRIDLAENTPEDARWNCLNRYTQTDSQTWQLPNIAAGSEAWAVLELPMQTAIAAQAAGSALHITVKAVDKHGERSRMEAALPALPVVGAAAWNNLPADELTNARLQEVSSAAVQRRIQAALEAHDWEAAEQLLRELDTLADGNAWLKTSVESLRERVTARDLAMALKESVYKNARMSNRLAAMQEDNVEFCASVERSRPAFLRRKASEGRRSE
jgi:Ca-activated chloride channel family protein